MIAMDEKFLAVTDDELCGPLGETVLCPTCGKPHPLEFGTSSRLLPDGSKSEPVEDRTMAFYKCKENTYLAGVAGQYLPGMVSGDKTK